MLNFPVDRVPEITDFYREALTDAGFTIEKDSPTRGGGAELVGRLVQ